MNQLGKTVEDLFTTKELREYTKTEYPFNLAILDKALKAKIETDPDYEVWVPFLYYKYKPFLRSNKPTRVSPPKYFISNLGKIAHLRNKEPFINAQWVSANYWHTALVAGLKTPGRIMVHRALGCCFIPLGDLGCHHPMDLQLNHKDGNKLNYELTNLEWTDHSGNTLHAHANGLAEAQSGVKNSRTKPAKGKVLRGEYAGFEFILSGRKEQMELGFIQTSINRCCQGITREHKHCVWSFATEEEMLALPKTLPKDILKNLMEMKPVPKRPPR